MELIHHLLQYHHSSSSSSSSSSSFGNSFYFPSSSSSDLVGILTVEEREGEEEGRKTGRIPCMTATQAQTHWRIRRTRFPGLTLFCYLSLVHTSCVYSYLWLFPNSLAFFQIAFPRVVIAPKEIVFLGGMPQMSPYESPPSMSIFSFPSPKK